MWISFSGENTQVVAVARIGSESQKIATRTLSEMEFIDMGKRMSNFSWLEADPKAWNRRSKNWQLIMNILLEGEPLHSLIIAGELHDIELSALRLHALPY